MKYATASQALVSLAADISTRGDLVKVRGRETRELRYLAFTLTNPLDRCVVVPGRRNNIFAAIAESVWVLAGRNDIAFLEPYLPRAARFSDDGLTWRAGYGPRLRSWHGVDQLDAIRTLLLNDPTSRRAVISIFDPAVDFEPSEDIPCTNWLSFSLREGVLDVAVAIRSNDLIWGFSGINSFEWTLLQEVVAYWLDAAVGEIHFFVSSMHIYSRHFERAATITKSAPRQSAWSGEHRSAFTTAAGDLPDVLTRWFDIESALRAGSDIDPDINAVQDALLADYLRMIRAFWIFNRDGRTPAEAALVQVRDSALVAAGLDYFSWSSGDEASPESVPALTIENIVPALVHLHRIKDSMYGDSWKRRGEQMAILANLARKLDRLSRFHPESDAGAESWFDTAIDLYVYAVKYKTFLLDVAGSPRDQPRAWSDGTDGFEALLKQQRPASIPLAMHAAIAAASTAFEHIEASVNAGQPPPSRLKLVDGLIAAAAQLVEATAKLNPASAAADIASWTTL